MVRQERWEVRVPIAKLAWRFELAAKLAADVCAKRRGRRTSGWRRRKASRASHYPAVAAWVATQQGWV
jgi:hypothetical protein